MTLSIVIPVYNTSQYLHNCVESVLACDCTDCEIILVDDGSTDGICPNLCDRIAAAHPHLIRVIHQENQGLGGARNTGLEAAQGEYLFFPDSDDRVTSDALSRIKAAIHSSGAEVIAFNFYSDDGAGHHHPMKASHFFRPEPFSVRENPEFLLSLPTAVCRAWKRELFLRTGIRYPSRVWYEDLRTSLKLMALAESVCTLDEPLYLYLQRPGSIMRSDQVTRNREILDAFDDLLPWFREQRLWETYEDVLCRLCIDHVYIAASIRVLRCDIRHPLLEEFHQYLQTHFPGYRDNPYLAQLPTLKRLAFRLLEGRHYRVLELLFRIKGT